MQVLESREFTDRKIQLQKLSAEQFTVASKPNSKGRATTAYFNNEDNARSFYELIIARQRVKNHA